MSELSHNHAAHGEISNDSINTEPWIERWWALLVIGYAFCLSMVLMYMANSTFGY